MHYLNDQEFKKHVDSRNEKLMTDANAIDFQISKIISTIGAGAIALSVTFYLNAYEIVFSWAVVISWLLLTFSLISQVLGYYFAREDSMKMINDIDFQINTNNLSVGVWNEIIKGDSLLRKRIKKYDRLAIETFIVGLLFLVIFSILNLVHEVN